jgi:hypothetical protein
MAPKLFRANKILKYVKRAKQSFVLQVPNPYQTNLLARQKDDFDANSCLFLGATEPFDSNRIKSKSFFKKTICRKSLPFYWGSRFICRKYGLSQRLVFLVNLWKQRTYRT